MPLMSIANWWDKMIEGLNDRGVKLCGAKKCGVKWIGVKRSWTRSWMLIGISVPTLSITKHRNNTN